MERILFSENHYQIRQIDATIEKTQSQLQEIIDAWQELTTNYLGKPAPVTIREIYRLYDGGQPMVGAIIQMIKTLRAEPLKKKYPEFSPGKLADMLPDPEPNGLFEAMKAARPDTFWNCFRVENGRVMSLPEKIEEMKDVHRDFAETPEQLKRLELVSRVLSALQEIRAENPEINPESLTVKGIVYCDPDGHLQPDRQFVVYNRLSGVKLLELVNL